MEESKKEKEMEVAHKRQQFQMHKEGYKDISNSINALNETITELVAKLDILIKMK